MTTKITTNGADYEQEYLEEALVLFDEASLSIGQMWTHKRKGYDVEITYVSRKVAGVKVKEITTGQVDAFCIELFLEWFSYKDNNK